MVNYAQLTKMDTTKLGSAAAASGLFAKDIAGRGAAVRKKADIPTGTWNGDDALAASDLLSKLPDPLYDLSDSADKGKKTLEDLAKGLDKAKEHLQGAHDAIKGTGITISADGTVTTPVVDDAQLAAENNRKAQDARNIIDEAVRMANEADATASDEMKSLEGAAKSSYMEIPGKKEQLDRAAELLTKPPGGFTPENARELNTLLEQNKNQEFAKQLMQRIGPKGLLEGSAEYSALGGILSQQGDPAAEDFKTLQRHLGESLALASKDGGLSPQWTQELMDRGAKPLENFQSQTGYRALAPLLEHGVYDKSFLTPVAEHMTRLENDAVNGDGNTALTGQFPASGNPFVIGDQNGAAGSPLNAVMGALDRSPAAAADYFHGHNDEFGLQYTDADGKALAPTANNIDYNLDKVKDDTLGVPLDPERLGDALEAAATGVPGGAGGEVPRPAHTQEMADIAQYLVHRFGEGDTSFDLRPGGDLDMMADNMSDIAQEYMSDINNSLMKDPETGEIDGDDLYLILPADGVSANFSRMDSATLLHSLGRHPGEAYELLGANQVEREKALNQYFDAGKSTDGLNVAEALEPSAKVSEIVNDGAADGFKGDAKDADEAHDEQVGLIGSAAKIAVGAIPTPLVGDTLGEIIDKVKDGMESDTVDQTRTGAQVLSERMRAHDEKIAERLTEGIAERASVSDPSYESSVKVARNNAQSEFKQLLEN